MVTITTPRQNLMKNIRAFILTAILCFTAGWVTHTFYHRNQEEKKYRLSDALIKFRPNDPCEPANSEEKEILEIAVSVLEKPASRYGALSLGIGAQRLLAYNLHRAVDSRPVCTPANIHARAEAAVTANRLFDARLSEYQLVLASRFPEPSPYVVEAVAKIAFEKMFQESDAFPYIHEDIRPYARTVLAEFGHRASSYAEKAYSEVSAESVMGTGAAQIAVAAGHPLALALSEKLMLAKLSQVNDASPVPWYEKKRLYELGQAIAFAGDEAKNHIEPIILLMRRKVQSWAPPFGMIPHYPKRSCDILKQIDGENGPLIREFLYCFDDRIPYDE
jgi:hypothetical protein